jgi:hypothetical protein
MKRQKKAILTDRQPALVIGRRGNELIKRLRTGRCELCEQRADVQVHQVPKLADLTRPGRPQPAWAKLMATKRRKTLVVCPSCHDTIHGQPSPQLAS